MDFNKRVLLSGLAGIVVAGSVAAAEPLVLEASKDTFGRSNNRNRNSGAAEALFVAPVPYIKTLVAFDLSTVTNKILTAEFRFRQHNSMPERIDLVVAPMVNTTNNAAWGEGLGNLGTKGQNSRPGEASYAFSAFNDVPWESAAGGALANLSDPGLWKPSVATLKGLEWKKGGWVSVPIADVALLEKIRKSKSPVITFGLWGSAGDGFYSISSNNTKWPAELHLELEQAKK